MWTDQESICRHRQTSKQMRLFEIASPELHNLSRELEDKYEGLEDLWLYSLGDSNPNTMKLDSIRVAKDARKEGVGSAVMQDITDYADAHGLRIVLTPGQKDDGHGTTSRSRLVKFYKRFGFYENRGRNKDFTISAGMIRDPQ